MYFIFNLFKSNTFSRSFCSWVYLTADLLLCDILPYDHIPKLQKRMGINVFVRRKECNTILDKIRTEGILSIIHLENDYTRGYQKVLSLTWKEPEIWIYSALFFNVVPFQLHTLVPSSFPVINTRSVEVNILVP